MVVVKECIISPIAIDFGAKNTGIYLNQFDYNDNPLVAQKKGTLIVLPEDKITLSQVKRRAKRHQSRGYKRRKLAKRLLHIILQKHYHFDLNTIERQHKEFIFGLLNRRGYTYLNAENINEEILDAAPLEWFVEQFPNYFKPAQALSKQVDQLSSDITHVQQLSEHPNFKMTGKFVECFKDSLPDDKDLIKIIKNSFNELKNAIDVLLKSKQDGHYYRTAYLTHIQDDIKANKDLCSLLRKTNINPDELYHIIGNISNLQLRVLRKYFNDERMKNGDYWDEKRMFRFFHRYVRAWHPLQQDKDRRKNILHILGQNRDELIRIWL